MNETAFPGLLCFVSQSRFAQKCLRLSYIGLSIVLFDELLSFEKRIYEAYDLSKESTNLKNYETLNNTASTCKLRQANP